jgi:hypothetical protein
MEITEFRLKLVGPSASSGQGGWWVLRLYADGEEVGEPEAYRDLRTALRLAPSVAEKFEDESAPDLAYYDPEHGGSKP